MWTKLAYSSLLFVVLLTVPSVHAMDTATDTEFRFNAGELGPIVLSVQIKIRYAKEELTAFPKKVAELTVNGLNDSGQPIGYMKFCVQAGRRTKGCDFQFWTSQVWMPGEKLLWMVDKPARPGIEKPTTIILVKFKSVPEKYK
jgi:hypothetical protein